MTRGLIRQADMGWILVGCILPDLPWILLRALPLEMSPYELRLYAIVQSSLALSLVAVAALACLSARPARTAMILGLGCVLHLLLDATQTKWANGVVLFAPLDWRVVNFGLYWPESWPTVLMTGFGAAYFIWVLLRERPWTGAAPKFSLAPGRLVLATMGIALYLILPLPLMSRALQVDPHYVATLVQTEARSGRIAGFDRAHMIRDAAGTPFLLPWTGERLALAGRVPPEEADLISVTGSFAEEGVFGIEALHVHPSGRRDFLSYLGLMTLPIWGAVLLYRRLVRRKVVG
ncbi:hypothetical protein M3P21_19025 [Ruegeria sp. 2012CJ41-6]|uniref:Metal-dependent hydrolase n=1 Tax=Ruegeria spongiae TaxID=2942209 RepID=A0ABT0Q6X6_9RHOB|nr:hypothetical protein [Ruegeria spongiae]MCL6285625.1 hypothetical protein [Ruegeria spongiae]